ncbi:DUF1122 family protein [Thermocrinis minervae]|uniref:DUF1122 domain-containing protein n=1 Tax=Thermocrinis minervae TaxID=381751 RepID=A0A1M6STK7_9AQUI|nr:DUF1122 family protein [Thermocrinis minervae]SHK47996.1 hypothetical protein SAMN05444391_1160 [Thermocrinis minervae]
MESLKKLLEGVKLEEGILRITTRSPGRFAEEENWTLCINNKRVLYAKVFYGRKPYWKEWVELFHIDPSFFGSKAEDTLYTILSKDFGRLFVEYYEDSITMQQLRKALPPEQTRLGSLLLSKGYRYLKDWYFPEGWMEGGYKLQAER